MSLNRPDCEQLNHPVLPEVSLHAALYHTKDCTASVEPLHCICRNITTHEISIDSTTETSQHRAIGMDSAGPPLRV